MYHLFII